MPLWIPEQYFKTDVKGKYCITGIVLKLNKDPRAVNVTYGAIESKLEERRIINPGVKDVCDVVIDIRRSKLPDPAELGNSGSFFKNPVVDKDRWKALRCNFPELVFYPQDDDTYKIPAGWLIEQCGWKGKRVGNVGCYEHQALVIVNYGGASGQEVWDHAMHVRESVRGMFGIELEPEVNVM